VTAGVFQQPQTSSNLGVLLKIFPMQLLEDFDIVVALSAYIKAL
jgi:hypothetical protein